MSRQQRRKEIAEEKKRIEKMSISEFENFMNAVVRNTRADTMEHFRQELHWRYGIGKKRWADVVLGVSHRIMAEDMEKGE